MLFVLAYGTTNDSQLPHLLRSFKGGGFTWRASRFKSTFKFMLYAAGSEYIFSVR